MFLLITLEDTIRIPPTDLGSPIEDILAHRLNKSLANKVLFNVGLLICVKDISHVGESYVHQSDGAIFTKCTFRMVVFRPQIGEILDGTLKSSSKDGLNISLGFFDSILLLPQYLNEPSKFDEPSQTWIWNFVDESETNLLRLEIGETIRFRVHSEEFADVSPDESIHNATPYKIFGSIAESGLGLLRWWL